MASKVHFLKLYLFLFCFQLQAQILEEKTRLINTLGEDYTTGTDELGNEYLNYEDKFTSASGEIYTRNSILYFRRTTDSTELCTHLKIIYPATEAESNKSFFNSNMRQLDSLDWIDPLSDYRYHMKLVPPFCVITIWLNGSGEIKE